MDIQKHSYMHVQAKSSPRLAASMPAGTQSIQRVVMILRELAARNREGARLADLVSSLDLEQPTVHRMLKSLIAESLAIQDPDTKRYYLGQAIYELGLAASQRFDLRAQCEPILSSLAAQTRDTTFLTVRSGDESVCLDRREGDSPIKVFTLAIGDRRPLGVGAGSMALLSAYPEPEIRRVISANSNRLASFGEKRPAALLAQVLEAKERGYSVRDLPGYEGIRAIGMAVLDSKQQPIAALSISTLVGRLTGKEFDNRYRLMREHCSAITKSVLTQ
ncbi:MAG TPA: IclR family transcriptional regulator [Ramlibacter sp.]|nr:IclR family transcriptional regulator [Ramlibacter sp.]